MKVRFCHCWLQTCSAQVRLKFDALLSAVNAGDMDGGSATTLL